ncbi:MAG TPA: hypothetical protein VK163_04920 [Opitutaceae bacterium]|nr:hypothetical protein [Opitutaceae bacterium]
MKISMLLAIHQRLVQHARLANLACAYATLRCFAVRVRRARLRGAVTLCQPDATRGRNWAELTALEGSQAQLEELFTDEDLMELADSIAFARGVSGLEIDFRIEEMDAEFVRPLEGALRRAGVALDLPAEAYDDWASEVVENYDGFADDADGGSDRG